jgi:hypothetical protein
VIHVGDEETLFETETEYGLLVDGDGKPLDGAPEWIEVLSVGMAKHSPYGPRDVRIYADCVHVETGELVQKFWGLTCAGKGCPQKVGVRCLNPIPKKGSSGMLRGDAAIALGRRLTSRERFQKSFFVGKKFLALIHAVRVDQDGNDKPASTWYSKVGTFLDRADPILKKVEAAS